MIFKKSKAEHSICNWLPKAYCGKQIASFFLIWDNVQYSILADLENPFNRQIQNVFQLLKNLPRKLLNRKTKRSKKNLNYINEREKEYYGNYNENTSFTGLSNYQTDTNVYVESEFTSMGESEKNIQKDFNFGNINNDRETRRYGAGYHYKNKSNNFVKKKEIILEMFKVENIKTKFIMFQKHLIILMNLF